MRTSFDFEDQLLALAKKEAKRRGLSLRALMERALRRYLNEPPEAKAYTYEDFSYGAGGLAGDLEWGDWDRLRDLAYGAED